MTRFQNSFQTQARFDMKPMTVNVEFNRIDIQAHTPTISAIFGRGEWPHQNILFVSHLSVYRMLEERMRTAYYTMGAYLETPFAAQPVYHPKWYHVYPGTRLGWVKRKMREWRDWWSGRPTDKWMRRPRRDE